MQLWWLPVLLAAPAARPDVPLLSSAGARTSLAAEVKRVARAGVPVTVVNFWATWCAPCRDELPALLRAHQAKQLNVLAVNVGDSAVAVKRFLQEEKLSALPVAFVSVGNAAPLGFPGLPASLVLQRGAERRVYGPLREDQLRQLARP